ncbi:MAG: hypothetical protein Q9216_002774 [Gyalolechia sp. 2 TL-2023]
MEVFSNPHRKEAGRIWRCLDYVFEIPRHISKDQKGRWVMTEIRDKMGIYIASRKVMAPSSMLERIGSHSPQATSGTSTSPTPSVGKLSQKNAELAHGYPAPAPHHPQGPVVDLKQDQRNMSSADPRAAMQMPAPPVQPDIDWHEWDKLFPPDVHTNYLTS